MPVEAAGIDNPVLRQRAERGKAKLTEQYLACRQGEPLAYVALEPYPAPEAFYIYEIFVLTRFRRQGVGSEILTLAEARARMLGYSVVRLIPRSLDPSQSDVRLKAWYVRRGYAETPYGEDYLEKSVVDSA